MSENSRASLAITSNSSNHGFTSYATGNTKDDSPISSVPSGRLIASSEHAASVAVLSPTGRSIIYKGDPRNFPGLRYSLSIN
jgi:hypothetical protein